MAELQDTDKEISDNSLQGKPVSFGAILQAAREAKQLTQQDVSNNLRYSVKQVNALENGEFQLLPDAMITRGFIRNYAKLLEIDAEPLLASYRQIVSAEDDNKISVRSSMRPVLLTKESPPWLKYILTSILVLLFLLAWLFYVDYMPKPTSVSDEKTPEVIEENAPTTTQSLPEAALPAAQRLAEGDVMTPDVLAEPDINLNAGAVQAPMNVADVKQTTPLSQIDFKPLAPSVSQQIQAPAITGTDKAVTMAFTAQTWVSVTDKSGSVVYEKMSHNGDVEAINAPLPLNLVIGNASATKLNVGGKDVDLTSNTKNNVARITLE